MPLNEPAPDFRLPDLQGRLHSLSQYRDRIVILNFWSAECPHAERTDRSIRSLLETWKGEVLLLAIASNRNEPAPMLTEAAIAREISPILVDAEQATADRYEAVTTPHVFVVGREGILRYRGAVDDMTFRRKAPTRFFLQDAVNALLHGRLPEPNETPAYGCTIVREI